MTQPLALIFYENLLTGNQLLNRLHDLDYRTQVVTEVSRLAEQAAQEPPLVVLVELGALAERTCAAIRTIRTIPATAHVPVIASVATGATNDEAAFSAAGRSAGATLVVAEAALVAHLGQILDQALHLD